MTVSPARRIAYQVLRQVEAERAYASDVLHEALDVRVKPADAALATEITLGVLRWRRLLDFLLNRHLQKTIERLDLAVALALRIGLYQLRFLERIPTRAAVNESVELVKMARKTSAASLVNAVLHKAAAEAASPVEQFLGANLPHTERLAILHSHPTWMVERWVSRLGEALAIRTMTANNERPRLSCVLEGGDFREEVQSELARAGLHIEPGLLLENAFAATGGSPRQTEAFRAGLLAIQDEASQAVPLLLGVEPGDWVIDLCGAPGGKTPALARASGTTGLVIAADRYWHRLRAMRAHFKRLRLAGVYLVELNAEQPLPFRETFDRILLDAPCSGTGTLARHPEIRWRLRPEQLPAFHQLQVRLLGNAIPALKPGGQMVYSTCSMEPEENEQVVAKVLDAEPSIRRLGARTVIERLRPHLRKGVDAETFFAGDGYFRSSPAAQHTDGFFAATLERSQSC
ncbi:MAG TPA: 16S rRNA (cytosine(967)-C(5))-methyltransferase RsmB [Candidatus Acidoferrales bacterium]|nr:16S rRNA (cytosine(967)-C(5))-methyltransferase RsmB [Candidatus Acidoferrales bacterium]